MYSSVSYHHQRRGRGAPLVPQKVTVLLSNYELSFCPKYGHCL